MASDALAEPNPPTAPHGAKPDDEPHLHAVAALDRSLPEGVTRDPSVDWEALDPCRTGAAKRQCVAARKSGGRCTAPALTGQVLCSAHAGRLDASHHRIDPPPQLCIFGADWPSMSTDPMMPRRDPLSAT